MADPGVQRPLEPELAAAREEAMVFAGIGTYRLLADGTVVYMDRGALRIFDLEARYPDPSVISGMPVGLLLRYLERPGSFRERVLRQGRVRDAEYHFETLTGEERWVIYNAYSVHDESRGREAIQVVAQDITARKRMETALRRSEEKTRALLRALPDLVFRLDSRGTILEVLGTNPDPTLLRPEEIVGTRLNEVYPAFADAALDAVQTALETGEVTTLEAGMGTPRGDVFFEARHVPTGDGEVLVVVRNLTEQRQAAEDRRRLEERIRRAQKLESLETLAGGVAHDFNNILTGVLGNAGVALEMLPEDSPIRNAVVQIQRGAEQAAEFTAELLAYSGRGTFVVELVDLSKVVRDMVPLLEAATARKARFELDIEPDPILVEADPTQLRQVVLNLVTNAAEAIEDPEGTIAIRTGVMATSAAFLRDCVGDAKLVPGDHAVLEVRDTGCGMPRDVVRDIFDPFFSTKFAGRGLGLASLLGIVRGHGGVVHVESAPERGTLFRVVLPRAQGEISTAEERPTPAPARSDGTVLVVDDEEAVRDVAQVILERAGFRVLTATDGVEGMRLFRQRAKDLTLVLLDMTMPRKNGSDTYREIREINTDIPVVLMSGYAQEDAVRRFGGEGLAGFLQKPFGSAQLTRRVREALSPP